MRRDAITKQGMKKKFMVCHKLREFVPKSIGKIIQDNPISLETRLWFKAQKREYIYLGKFLENTYITENNHQLTGLQLNPFDLFRLGYQF